jgi:DNA-binding NarL/FixJ family response regulator
LLPNAIEALAAAGEAERAQALLEPLEHRARALGHDWCLAAVARCRGLLLAERGDVEAAERSFADALALHERLSLPLDRARTELVRGAVLRRAKRRRAARESLEAALATFERLGAGLWAARARAELSRVGGRAASRGDLTAGERRIAELVAEGKTNKEVAASLFVSVRTVEAALTRTYGKLGVRSRTELANRLGSHPSARGAA